MNMIRPARRGIPVRIKKAVCERQNGVCRCGCGMTVSHLPRTGTKFDHRPPIRLRNISADGADYVPHQHDTDYIDAICAEEHQRRTNGTGATTAGTDTGYIKKERKREKAAAGAVRPKRKWSSRSMGKRPPGSGNGFPPRGSTPMRRKT